MGTADRLAKWTERWTEGNTKWHIRDVNYSLVHHGALLLPSGPRRVLVPLCGKTVDLRWFYDEGHTVVGIEAVEKGVLEFFSEQHLDYTTENLGWAKHFKTKDNRLHMYCCDVMKVDVTHLGKFDAVWDRGSLVALYEEDRKSYAQIIKSLLAPDFRYLLNVTQYTPNERFSGPPGNVPTELVEQLYGDTCKLELLETVNWPSDDDRICKWGLTYMVEVVLLLTPKS
ncbi:thiopurine S-methyltransferase [Procambarus clarkii]|uniref:thiopurine S-methyltransferase n=1 Tax=Procambarus clarkii TaxID=6728 RepID=UPI001E678C68|nr:thiopurine S-methyltransferase-like [Procambarus clarkii]